VPGRNVTKTFGTLSREISLNGIITFRKNCYTIKTTMVIIGNSLYFIRPVYGVKEYTGGEDGDKISASFWLQK
jgi:hypothetical protein